jgi:hypothetical protein
MPGRARRSESEGPPARPLPLALPPLPPPFRPPLASLASLNAALAPAYPSRAAQASVRPAEHAETSHRLGSADLARIRRKVITRAPLSSPRAPTLRSTRPWLHARCWRSPTPVDTCHRAHGLSGWPLQECAIALFSRHPPDPSSCRVDLVSVKRRCSPPEKRERVRSVKFGPSSFLAFWPSGLGALGPSDLPRLLASPMSTRCVPDP